MNTRIIVRGMLLASIISIAGCSQSGRQPESFVKIETNTEHSNVQLEKIVREAMQVPVTQVQSTLGAPVGCMAPWNHDLDTFLSESDDSSTHGKKLYELYANKAEEYREISRQVQPSAPEQFSSVGQVLIKDSFHAKRLESRSDSAIELFDGSFYEKGDRFGYFVMIKMPPESENTDQGWIYATVKPDKKTITSVGRIESCMRCHEKARHDRLFGIK